MIDIAIITNTGILKKTGISLDRYAEKEQIVLRTNKGVDWFNGERLAEHRLRVAEETTADWIFLLDHDDELVQPLPLINHMNAFDYITFPFYDVSGRTKTIENCSFQRAFGFHMILAKRDVAIAALKYVCEGRYYRDDTAYITWLMENGKGAKATKVLVRKTRDYLPIQVPELQEIMQQECNDIWKSRLVGLRQAALSQQSPLLSI